MPLLLPLPLPLPPLLRLLLPPLPLLPLRAPSNKQRKHQARIVLPALFLLSELAGEMHLLVRLIKLYGLRRLIVQSRNAEHTL